MLKTLEIKNFKSIRHLKLDCERVNIFIGQPNTGKSNILESLGLLSFAYYSAQYGYDARQFIRFERTSNLFYDDSIDTPLEISCDIGILKIQFQNGRFEGGFKTRNSTYGEFDIDYQGDYDGLKVSAPYHKAEEALAPIKYYRYRMRETFPRREADFLLPPSGDNLMSLLLSKKELRALANQPFASIGLRLGLRPQEYKIEVIKDSEDVIVSYPYHLTSETLQRLIFYMAAIYSNKDSVLVFEEPESHAFPYYTKYLAEMIALDENNNQYFISTHNPYFLLPILEKSPHDEIAVFITYYQDYETKVKPLSQEDLQRLTEIDVFSNLEAFLDEE